MSFVRETWLLFRANVRTTLRNPVWTIFGLFNPICYLLLYAPLYANLSGQGSADAAAYNGFVPGLVIMTALFTTAFAGFSVIEHLRSGYLERLRVTPVHRLSLPLGYILRDVVMLVIQCSLLLAMATLMGMRADGIGLLLLLGLLVLIGLLMTSCSYALALLFKDESALASTVNFVSLPLLLLSGVLLPLTLAPQLMRTVASVNPFSHAVEAARALVSGHLTDSAVPLGFVLLAGLALVGLFWVTRSFRQATS